MMASTKDKIVRAFVEQRDPIADSDLDDEQPVTLQVTLTLGEWRRFKRTQESMALAKQALGG